MSSHSNDSNGANNNSNAKREKDDEAFVEKSLSVSYLLCISILSANLHGSLTATYTYMHAYIPTIAGSSYSNLYHLFGSFPNYIQMDNGEDKGIQR